MPVQYLGRTPARTSPLTQMLQGLAGGLKTGMGYMQQAEQQKLRQAELDFAMEKRDDEFKQGMIKTIYQFGTMGDETAKAWAETLVKGNPETMALMERSGLWMGGPEGGFPMLAKEEPEPPWEFNSAAGFGMIWNRDTGEVKTRFDPKVLPKGELKEGETGYYQFFVDGKPVGDIQFVGDIDPDKIVREEFEGVVIHIDMSDPNNPKQVGKPIVIPSREKTAEELLEARRARIEKASSMTDSTMRIPWESIVLIEDTTERERLMKEYEITRRSLFKENLILQDFSDDEATEIAKGARILPDLGFIHTSWSFANPRERARFEWFITNTPKLLREAEARPDIWDKDTGTFVKPLKEKGIVEQLITGIKEYPEAITEKFKELPEYWEDLKDKVKGVIPTEKIIEAPAEEPLPTTYPKEGVLYTPEINAWIEEAKADAKDSGKMEALQIGLKEKGYWDYNITGKWTPTLERALRKFCRDYMKGKEGL